MSDGPATPPAAPGRLSKVSLRAWILIAGSAALIGLSLTGRRPAPAQKPQPNAYPTRLPVQEAPEPPSKEESAPASSYQREVERPRPVQNLLVDPVGDAREKPSAAQAAGGPANRRRDDKRTLPEIFRMPGTAAPRRLQPEDPKPSPAITGAFAPYGRLLKCELVNALDSATGRPEPIIALVTEDADWNGDVLVPAGTEAFGYAKPEAIVDAAGRGRLVDVGEWTLVLPAQEGAANGREWAIRGRAVDRRELALGEDGRGRSWDIRDGTPGLVGYTVSTLDGEQIKLFAAAALSGLAQGVGAVQRLEPAAGLAGALGTTVPAPTAGNVVSSAGSQAAVEALNQAAERIRQEISKRGTYVAVPAGKPFYLFVEQTLDPSQAAVGLKAIRPSSSP
jgi:hypothetical protein